MSFLLVKQPFSVKIENVVMYLVQIKTSEYSLVDFWTKSIQYECKLHVKTFFFSFLKHSTQISKPPP